MSRPMLIGLIAAGAFLIGATSALADSITATCTPGPCGTWQSGRVQVDWTVDVPSRDADEGCGRVTISAEGVNTRTCRALAPGGHTILSATVTVLIDVTPPVVMAVERSPGPNALGWHTSPLTATFVGADPGLSGQVSGLQVCTRTTYAGPDRAAAQVTGTCVDRAGNQSAPRIETFQYDGTAPDLASASADIGDRMLRIRWSEVDGPVEVARTPGIGSEARSVLFAGSGRSFTDRRVKNLTQYRYEVTTTDQAGNQTTRTVTARALRRILAPSNRAQLHDPPAVRWSEIPNAGYYNLQVFRGSQKVLSVWPRTPAYQMKRRWQFDRQAMTLTPGTYRAYVWPGFGAFARQRYGRIVGTVAFTVR